MEISLALELAEAEKIQELFERCGMANQLVFLLGGYMSLPYVRENFAGVLQSLWAEWSRFERSSFLGLCGLSPHLAYKQWHTLAILERLTVVQKGQVAAQKAQARLDVMADFMKELKAIFDEAIEKESEINKRSHLRAV